MKAVILVGGQATRLRPLTLNTPKAMIPVLNTPFLEHVIRHLGRHGVTDIVLAQHYLAGPIESYLGDGSQLDASLTYVVEEEARGTAGAIKNVEKYLDGPFLALNGDIFTDLDFTAMVDFHRQRGAQATIALTPVDDPTAYGLIETDADGRVTRFLEKPDPSEVTTNMINAGTYVLEEAVLSHIPSGRQVSIERETFPLLVSSGQPVYAYPSSGYWMDTGTPEKYLQLHRDLLCGKSAWYSPSSGDEVLAGDGCRIHSTAELTGPVVIGPDCTIGAEARLTGPAVLGPGCSVGQGSVVEDSILWQGVRLGARVRLRTSLVADGCHLKDDVVAEGAVIADRVTVEAGVVLEPGSRIQPGRTVGSQGT